MAAVWRLASLAVILAVPLVLTVASVNSLLFDPAYYAAVQTHWAVGRTTEYSLEALRPINNAIVTFFNTPGLSLPAALAAWGADRAVFSARELTHMNDVRSLIWSIDRIELAALAGALAIVAARFVVQGLAAVRWTANRLLAGAGVTLAAIVLFGALTMVDFEQLFLTFHLLSFDNDAWMLDPSRDNLIRFFPFEFWFEATVTVAVRTVLSALVVALAAWAARTWVQRRTA